MSNKRQQFARIVNVDNLPYEEVLRLAKIGTTALVDEATGYQEHRPQNELRRIFDKSVKDPKAAQKTEDKLNDLKQQYQNL